MALKYLLKQCNLLLLSGVLLLLLGCNSTESTSKNGKSTAKDFYRPTFSEQSPLQVVEYSFAVHPLHNPQRLFKVFGPLIAYLNSNIPNAKFSLQASRNYAAFDEKLYAQKYDFALPNPYQTINAVDKGYKVFAKMGDDHNFRGIILVRKDSGIEKAADLKGKIISYPALTALAATMLPQDFLNHQGLNVEKDVINKYVGSQESSIMNVFLGQSQAAATWPPPWKALSKERPELEKELTVKWKTKSLPNNGLVALKTVPPEIVMQVQKLLIELHTTEKGLQILGPMELSKFEIATEDTYKPVRKFITHFSEHVRKVGP